MSDLKRAFADEGITLLACEDINHQLPKGKRGRTFLLSMTPRVMVAVCETRAAAESMSITSWAILGSAAGTEFAKAVHHNVVAFSSASDGASRKLVLRALAGLEPPS